MIIGNTTGQGRPNYLSGALQELSAARSNLFVPAALVTATILFNPILAIVNGHYLRLSGAHVAISEILIVCAAHAWILMRFRPAMMKWYALLVLLAGVSLARMIATGDPDVKFLRDVALIPTFVLLGLTVVPTAATGRLVTWIAVLIAGVALFEAFYPGQYAHLFQIKEFYIATRGVDPAEFTNAESSLYVSATRPDERFLGFVSWHRLSSLFLEPVSLGNFCVITTAFICAFWNRLSVASVMTACLANGIILVGSDGRLALISCMLIILAALLSRILPKNAPAAYLPATIGVAMLLVSLLDMKPGTDDFPGRIAYTAELIRQMSLSDWIGISNGLVDRSVDSGIVYMIVTQSIFGVVAIWTALVFFSDKNTTAQTRYLNAVCIYLSLNMMVSFSFLTIKTAGIVWFLFGVLQNDRPATDQLGNGAPERRTNASFRYQNASRARTNGSEAKRSFNF